VGCRPDSPSANSLCSDSKFQIWCGLHLRRRREEGGARSDQSPEAAGVGGVEWEFDLAKVDGMAGVRKGRENMEGVIERRADERCRKKRGGNE